MRTFFVLVILFNLHIAKSQGETINNLKEVEDNSLTNNKIGVSFSILSGGGLTYLHTFDNRFSIKSQFIVLGNIEEENSSENNNYIITLLGSELQYDIIRKKYNRAYLLCGFYYEYDKFMNNLKPPKNSYEIYRAYNIAIGAGYELQIYKRISFALDIGYYGLFNQNSFKKEDLQNNNIRSIEFSIGAGISFYYNL